MNKKKSKERKNKCKPTPYYKHQEEVEEVLTYGANTDTVKKGFSKWIVSKWV